MKRLGDTLSYGDPIHAVIHGSGINYDGKTNGITAPNGVAQTDLFNTVYARFHIDPAEIEYIMTHGTGTRLGDPVEIHALDDAFKTCVGHRGRGYCALTSCKSNFGHTFAASGLVSLIALVQAIRHRTIPASLNCEQDSDYVDWQDSPFYVNKQSRPWTSEGSTGAVSAFGMSGTNAHLVVRSYEGAWEPSGVRAPYYLLGLSAKTADALQHKITDMSAFLENGEGHDLASISGTLLEGRWHFRHRCAIVIQDRDDAIQVWRQVVNTPNAVRPNLFRGEVPRGFTARRAMSELALELLDRCRMHAETPGLDHTQYQEQLLTLADLYCQGYELPWNRLFPPAMRRVGLPTYPFSREHYWVTEHVPMPAVGADVPAAPAVAEATGTLMLQACWSRQDIARQGASPKPDGHLVIFCDLPHQDGLKADLDSCLLGARCLFLRADDQDIGARFQFHAARLLTEIKTLITRTAEDRAATHLLQVVVSNRHEAWPLTGLSGLLQTARLEHPSLVGQFIAVEPETDAVALAEILQRECHPSSQSRVRYDAGQRQVLGWREMVTTGGTEPPVLPWRDGATYLITGGAGGLGRLIGRDIVARAAQVNLILTGRSTVGADAALAWWRDGVRAGARVVYRRGDMTDGRAVIQLIRDIESECGGLHGIIHAAGIVRDNSLRHKTVQELRDVLAPKVSGLVHLDQATQHLDLDFLVCFSSMTGVLGNPGQADYAAANAFMDAYAAYRNGLVTAGQRRGRMVSIDWSLWREGGMVPMGGDEAWETLLRQHTGMIPMHTAAGLRALYQAMAAGEDQVLVAEGVVSVMRDRLLPSLSRAHEQPAPIAVAGLGPDRLREHTVTRSTLTSATSNQRAVRS